mmetsp:Transcript_5736/g.8082  ORF Transcript_5736/g.8082 Transcript_5736/m.8082 type:complete len:244 (-) Transcript_5736:469-1200(-)
MHQRVRELNRHNSKITKVLQDLTQLYFGELFRGSTPHQPLMQDLARFHEPGHLWVQQRHKLARWFSQGGYNTCQQSLVIELKFGKEREHTLTQDQFFFGRAALDREGQRLPSLEFCSLVQICQLLIQFSESRLDFRDSYSRTHNHSRGISARQGFRRGEGSQVRDRRENVSAYGTPHHLIILLRIVSGQKWRPRIGIKRDTRWGVTGKRKIAGYLLLNVSYRHHHLALLKPMACSKVRQLPPY